MTSQSLRPQNGVTRSPSSQTKRPNPSEEEEDLFDYYYHAPGSAPGTLSIEPDAYPTEIDIFDYTP